MTDLSDAGDEQDVVEALDDDELRVDADYSGDEPLNYPPERLMGSGPETITPLDESVGESVADRGRRELADPLAEELQRAVELDEEEEYEEEELAGGAASAAGADAGGPVDPAEEAAAALAFLSDPEADIVLADPDVSFPDPDAALEDDLLLGEDNVTGDLVLDEPELGEGSSWNDLRELTGEFSSPLGDESAEDAAVHLTSPPPWHEAEPEDRDR